MKIQSASLDIPGSCPNQCKFCVSEIWHNQSDMLNNVFKFDTPAIEDWVRRAFTERLLYLKQLGVNTLVLTGTASEPLFNEKYIKFFHEVNQSFKDNKFVNIEVQTSGVGLSDEKLNHDNVLIVAHKAANDLANVLKTFMENLNVPA